MSCCNQTGDLSPLGPSQCFRERPDYSINPWNSHSILTLLDNAEADTDSCPSCAMSVATRVFHMSSADSTLDKKTLVMRRTVCTNMHWHQVPHTTTHRKTPLLSVWIKCTLREPFGAGSKHTPNSLTDMLFGGSMLLHGHITCCFITAELALLCPRAVHTKSWHSLSRWLSIPEGHPRLSSCQFSR